MDINAGAVVGIIVPDLVEDASLSFYTEYKSSKKEHRVRTRIEANSVCLPRIRCAAGNLRKGACSERQNGDENESSLHVQHGRKQNKDCRRCAKLKQNFETPQTLTDLF